MYKLIKSFIMLLLFSNPVTAALAGMWSLIEFLLNILLKIFVVFPLYLFELLLNFLKTFLEGLFSLLGNPQEIINKCKITIGIIVFGFSVFWLYCGYAVFKSLPFSNGNFIQSIQIFGTSFDWWAYIIIAFGYIIFCIISLSKELGLLAVVFTIFNIVSFNNKNCLEVFLITAIIFLIYGVLYFINKFYGLEIRNEIMRDIEADCTLKGVEKWSYYRRKKW